jgi:hypothetical protein
VAVIFTTTVFSNPVSVLSEEVSTDAVQSIENNAGGDAQIAEQADVQQNTAEAAPAAEAPAAEAPAAENSAEAAKAEEPSGVNSPAENTMSAEMSAAEDGVVSTDDGASSASAVQSADASSASNGSFEDAGAGNTDGTKDGIIENDAEGLNKAEGTAANEEAKDAASQEQLTYEDEHVKISVSYTDGRAFTADSILTRTYLDSDEKNAVLSAVNAQISKGNSADTVSDTAENTESSGSAPVASTTATTVEYSVAGFHALMLAAKNQDGSDTTTEGDVTFSAEFKKGLNDAGYASREETTENNEAGGDGSLTTTTTRCETSWKIYTVTEKNLTDITDITDAHNTHYEMDENGTLKSASFRGALPQTVAFVQIVKKTVTETTTQKETEKATEKETQKVTEKYTEKITGKAAEKTTETETEKEDVKAEVPASAAMPAVAFDQKVTTENGTVMVHIDAEEGAFEEGTSMTVTPVTRHDILDKAIDAAGGKGAAAAMDITFTKADGTKTEPLKPIHVKMISPVLNHAEEAHVVHVADSGTIDVVARKSDGKTIESTSSEAASSDAKNAVSFESDSFSVYAIVYTVDFEYSVNGKMYQFSLPGGEKIALSDLIEVLGIIGDTNNGEKAAFNSVDSFLKEVANVEFSDESLVKVTKNEEGNDWTLESLQAFNTEESLTITMKNGDVLTIKVTDAQLTKDVLTASGETYTITVEYDDDAGIPEGSDLNVREILDGTKEFAGYMVDSAAELSVDSSNITFARFFDIEIVGEHGEKIEPEKPVQVKIEYKDALAIGQEESLSVVHFADDGTEVIDDVVLDMNGTSIKYAQDSFSVTGTVVSGGPRNGQQYMLIAEYEGANYLINNDGTLIPVTDVDPTHIKTDNPMLWTYYYNYGANFRFASEASGFNADQTASGFYYRYLDPNSDSGLREENAANPNLAGATRINYNNYRVSSAADSSKYIGISDEGGTLHVVGNQNSGKAARITLYSADDVKPSDPANHTVNHIDISISGTAQVDVPLAYGIYYYKDGNTWKKIIVGNNVEDVADGAELAAQYTNRTEKLAPAQVGITASDMKAATITAKDKNGNVVDNAFYITGYSANEATQWSTDQVRIEGSFKVANLDRPASEFGAWDLWNVNNENVRRARLDNKITYTVEAIKPLELPLTYTDDQGVKHQLYQSMTDDEPMTINAEVPMSASFDYWTYIQGVGNECPPLQPAWGFTTEWQQGGIHPWGISGMDFVLKADVVDVPAKIVALEVSKKIVDEHGKPITNLSAPIDAKFEVFQDKPGDPTTVREVGSEVHDYGTYTKLHDLNVNIATNGSGHRYDYNVSDGMYYIRESRDGLPETIATADGHTYTYIRTEIRTEYSYRANDYRTRDPETGQTIEQTMHETTIASSNANLNSIPEVLGAYTDDNGAPENNEFLEFYFYNVYSETETPPPPEPVYKTLDIEIDKKWQDGETIVDPSQVDGTITFYLHQIQTQNNSSTTDATGSGYPKTFTVRAADGWKLTIPDLPWYETDTHDSYVKTYQYYLEEDTSKATGSASNYKAPSFTNGYGSINSPVTSDTEDDVVRVEVVNKTGNVLRIQKRWLNVDPETAPNVRITLYRQGVKESGDPINGYQPEEIRVIDLSDSNRVQGENWWQLEIPFPADTTFKYPEGNQEYTGHYVYYISENRTNNKNENISNDFQDPRYITLVGNQVIDDYRAYNLVTNGQGINYENSQWNPRKDKQYIINGESVPLYASSTDQKDTTMIVMNNPKNNFDQLRFSKKWYKVASNGQMTQANSTELNQYAIGIQIYQKLDADGYDWVPYAAPFYIASSTSVINNNNTPYIMSADMPFKFNGNPQNTNGEWTWNIIRGDDASPGFPQYATINGQQINYKYEAREIGVYKNPQYPNGVSNADQLERVFDYSNTQEWSFDRNHTQPQGINVEAGKLKVTKEWQGNNVGSCIYFHVFQGNKDITDDIVANYDNYGLSEYQVYDDGTHKALIVKSDGEYWEELLIQGLAMAPSGGGTPYQYSIQEIGYSEADGTNCWDGEAVINSDGTTRTDPHGNTVITHISELLTGYQIDSNGVSEPVNGRSGATSVTGNTVHEITVKNKYEEKYKDLEITKIWTDQLGNYLTWDQDITVDLYNGNNLIAESILLFVTPPDQQATKSFVIDGVTYNWEVSLDASGKVYTFRFKDLPAKINNQEAVYSVVEKELTGFETLYGFISDGQFRPNTNGESASDGQTIKNMKVELGGPELPSTGGPGTDVFRYVGLLLTALAVTGLVMRKKRASAR